MLQSFFVSRKAYDNDVRNLRLRAESVSRELRELSKEKMQAEQNAALLKSQIGGMEYEISRLRKQIEKKPAHRDISDYADPVPEGETARREYMAQIASNFQGGLRDKLTYMGLQFRNQTGMFPLSERETDFFRACINVVGLLLDWGEACVAEHRSNIAKANNKDESSAFDGEQEAINR